MKVIVKCQQCGKEFYVKPSRFREGRVKYCSRECRSRGVPTIRNITERFWEKVAIKDSDECWYWIAGTNVGGYGSFRIGGDGKGGHVPAHRFSYELAHGTIPQGLDVLHKCDHPSCVNPRHLWLGTDADNAHDCMNKGRATVQIHREVFHYGEKHGMAKLTEADIIKIRDLHREGVSQNELARQFCISRAQIGRIINRTRWCHVP